MNRLWNVALVMAAGVMASFITEAAQAVSITINGSSVFDDGFEAGTIGSPPNPTSAGPGEWQDFMLSAGSAITVYGPASPGPGAAVGSNYLRLNRTASGDATVYGKQWGAVGNIGDTVRAEWWMWVPDGRDFGAIVILENAAFDNVAAFATGGAAGSQAGTFRSLWYRGSWDYTDVNYTPQQWQMWSIEWVVGSGEAIFGIDGVTQLRASLPDGGAGGVDRIRFTTSSPPYEWYVDGNFVPEPNAWILASLGLLGWSWFGRKTASRRSAIQTQ